MKCTKCGAELPEGTLICPECRTVLDLVIAEEPSGPDDSPSERRSDLPAAGNDNKDALRGHIKPGSLDRREDEPSAARTGKTGSGKSGGNKKKKKSSGSRTGGKALFVLVIFACCVVAILLGIGIGRSIAVPMTVQETTPAPTAAADTAAPEVSPEITVAGTPAPTSEPTPGPTPEPTPMPVIDSETAVSEFCEIRSALRAALIDYIDGPRFDVTEENRADVFEKATAALSSLDFIRECSGETDELYILTEDGLTVTLGSDGVLAADNCPADLTGNFITERITDAAAVTADELTDNAAFAAALETVLNGNIGICSYSDPDTELVTPLGSNDALGTLCYVVIDNSQELLSGSNGFIYTAAVYDLLWGENPLDSEADNDSERVLSLPEGLSSTQLYSYFAAREVLPGALLVASPYYVNGDTVTQTAILLGYDGESITVLAMRGGTAFIQRSDWATFLSFFDEGCYLRYVYSPTDEYAQERFAGLSSPEYSESARVFSPDPDTLDRPTLSFTDYTTPTALLEGGGFGVHGLISTDAGTITSVTVTVTGIDGVTYYNIVKEPDAAQYDLRTEIDAELSFGTLPIGSYVYTITATAVSGSLSVTETLMNTAFTVTSNY